MGGRREDGAKAAQKERGGLMSQVSATERDVPDSAGCILQHETYMKKDEDQRYKVMQGR